MKPSMQEHAITKSSQFEYLTMLEKNRQSLDPNEPEMSLDEIYEEIRLAREKRKLWNKFLEANQSKTPSKWREEAEWRRENSAWLRHSQKIAVKVLIKMKEQKLSQKALAERMNCTQQYVSKILKGQENMSLDTITRLENALDIKLILI